jgi:hypothetical protein
MRVFFHFSYSVVVKITVNHRLFAPLWLPTTFVVALWRQFAAGLQKIAPLAKVQAKKWCKGQSAASWLQTYRNLTTKCG